MGFRGLGDFSPLLNLCSQEHNENPVDLRLAAIVKGDGLAWGTPESPEEGLHIVAGGCCPGVFKMHHFIS